MRASAAVVAPMTYVQLLVAAVLGWLVFGTPPDWSTLCGRGPDHRRRPAALALAKAEGGAGAGMIIPRTASAAQDGRP